MTDSENCRSLSAIDMAVLARLSCRTPPSPIQLVTDVTEIATPGEISDRAREAIDKAITALRRRGLVEDGKLRLTKDGKSALREALATARTPTWAQFCAHWSARALALPPASDQARHTLKSRDSIAIAVLRQRGSLPAGVTITAICDALIAETLGLPRGKLSLSRIRAHVLSRRFGQAPSDDPFVVAARLVDAPTTDKEAMIRALVRRGRDTEHPRRSTPGSPAQPAVRDQTLLAIIRDAITNIGADGRVGREKVFVSAIWHQISSDHRASNLSLETFKRWLVDANRDQLLALERADAVGAMNPKLVAESEIKSLGTTFHFVLDRQPTQLMGE